MATQSCHTMYYTLYIYMLQHKPGCKACTEVITFDNSSCFSNNANTPIEFNWRGRTLCFATAQDFINAMQYYSETPDKIKDKCFLACWAGKPPNWKIASQYSISAILNQAICLKFEQHVNLKQQLLLTRSAILQCKHDPLLAIALMRYRNTIYNPYNTCCSKCYARIV